MSVIAGSATAGCRIRLGMAVNLSGQLATGLDVPTDGFMARGHAGRPPQWAAGPGECGLRAGGCGLSLCPGAARPGAVDALAGARPSAPTTSPAITRAAAPPLASPWASTRGWASCSPTTRWTSTTAASSSGTPPGCVTEGERGTHLFSDVRPVRHLRQPLRGASLVDRPPRAARGQDGLVTLPTRTVDRSRGDTTPKQPLQIGASACLPQGAETPSRKRNQRSRGSSIAIT